MSVTNTPRLGVTQWSSGSDPFNRSQLTGSFAALENVVAGYLQGTVRPSASTDYLGFFFFNTTGNALSYCDGAVWWDLVAGDGNFGSPVALTITSVNNAGVQSTAARSDHTHGMPGFGTPSSIGTANSAGSGDTVARANHIHNIGSGAVNSSAMFAAGVVGATALATDAVETIKIQDLAVTTGKLANGAVIGSKLATDAVTTGNITALAVTDAKINDVASTKVTGVFLDAQIPSFTTAKITSGTFADSFIPSLAATKITSGTFAIARIPTGTSSTTVSLGNHTHAYAPTASPTFTGQVTVPLGNVTTPGIGVAGSADTGLFWSSTVMAFTADGDETLRVTSGGANVYTRISGKDINDFLEFDQTNTLFQFYLGNVEVMRIGSTGSGLHITEDLGDIGNVETLRANRTAGGSAVTIVGFFSSWGEYKEDIIPLAESPRWNRDWFMAIEPKDFRRKSTNEREFGFLLDEFQATNDNMKYLTTKGDNWGDSPDEFAILAATVLEVQDLIRKVDALEVAQG